VTAAKRLEPLDIKDAPARPFCKWAGGKTQLLAELRKRMPHKFGRYHEPFVGGGALLFSLADSLPGRLSPWQRPKTGHWATINDANPLLIATYRAICVDVEGVIERLHDLQNEYRTSKGGEKVFYRVRDRGPGDKPAAIAAYVIFLNKTCFNGLWRVNRKGLFNVPHGKRPGQVVICDQDNLRRVSQVLQHCSINCGDFEVAAENAKRGDFVYFDPPYVPRSADSDFTAYTKEPFGPAEQERLRDVVGRLKRRGVKVMLSNADVPYVRKLYKGGGFTIDRVSALRAINSKADRRGPVGEVIIT
jgi:DNA adenine methylase